MYDDSFYTENARVALAAAEIILPWVLHCTEAKSVIDVGCGSAAWASVAKRYGCGVYGVDGNVPNTHLLIDREEFETADLTDGVSCEGYDLAICLEVGEHLPAESAPALVKGLCEAQYVLWSAAVPGQRGVDHQNERWPRWWERHFMANNYCGSCDIREIFWDNRSVAPFYRQNFVLYAQPKDLLFLGMVPGVRDEVHPENSHIPCP